MSSSLVHTHAACPPKTGMFPHPARTAAYATLASASYPTPNAGGGRPCGPASRPVHGEGEARTWYARLFRARSSDNGRVGPAQHPQLARRGPGVTFHATTRHGDRMYSLVIASSFTGLHAAGEICIRRTTWNSGRHELAVTAYMSASFAVYWPPAGR